MQSSPSYSLLGVHVTPLDQDDLHALIERGVAQGVKWIVSNHNLHSVYTFHRDPAMREFYSRAAFVHVDGMPLIGVARLLGYPFERRHRVTYVDWIRPLISMAARKGWRVFYLGSKPGVAEAGASILRTAFPELIIATETGYFDATPGSPENSAVVARINAFRPNLLLVGMGMPRQERWIVQNLERLDANIILNAGACMDYVAGAIKTPPRWMGRLGLEWLFRVASEPQRLWRRYLIEPVFLLGPLLSDVLRRRKRP